uniref:G-protein coupled receptors family 1 profile domain-containing protein n=1 Tax=Chelydra serpentina TaxID=8475 RepID=A0A8C3SZV4_CHESE
MEGEILSFMPCITTIQKTLTEFILLGFGSGPAPHVVPFLVFLVIYMTTVLGNASMILLIRANARLHTPMYFFLMNLSVLDLCFASTIAPKAMVSFLAGSKAISYNGCASQFFLFSVFLTSEGFLLAAMAYDRYAAICNPLLYPITMSKWVCVQLVAGSYFAGCVNSMVQTGFTFKLHYCGSNEIDHFFCDGPPLISLATSDTYINNLVMLTLCGLIIGSTSLFVLISYAYIISIILRIHSAEGRRKAFSTCTSHLIAVSLFGCITQLYFFVFMVTAECFLLLVMSYDRYLAICNPLHYATLMRSGFMSGAIIIFMISQLTFCGPNEIDHFFCDLSPIIKLSCSDICVLDITAVIFSSMFTLPPFVLTLASYVHIISTILRIPSTTGRQKAFSTCSSHLIVVTIFYGTLVIVYLLPKNNTLRSLNKVFSVFYTVLTPIVNPLIYSLRNKEVKEGLMKARSKLLSSPQVFTKSKVMFLG